jgi:predicted alpha/beta superfamily hydrolase
LPTDEGPPAHLAGDQPANPGQLEPAADRTERHAEPRSELSLRRQLLPARQAAVANALGDRLAQRLVARTRTVEALSFPDCHRDNLPVGYESATEATRQSYPVLYLLDGRPSFRYTAGIVHGLAESGVIPRMLVVGVPNTNRWRDLTPTPSLEIASSGGGERFLDFVEKELIPYVAGRCRTTEYRIFAGHSLGGLTVLEALATRPTLFAADLAGSPSLEWDNARLVEKLATTLGERSELRAHLVLYLGDERIEREPHFRLLGLLERQAPPGLEWESWVDESLDHLGVRVPGTVQGLRAIFRDWDLRSEQILSLSDDEIAHRYAQASAKYGVLRELGFGALLEAGYWGVHQRSTAARGIELFERLVTRYPDSPLANDSLGEGYERTGQPERALAQFEIAYALAVAEGNTDLEYFRGHLERVRAALEAGG